MLDSRISGFLFIAALGAFLVGAAFFAWAQANPAFAHQPDGVGPSHGEIAQQPCPHGHEDICESRTEYGVASRNGAVSVGAGASIGEIVQRSQQLRVKAESRGERFTDLGAAGGADVNLAITSGISALPWVVDGTTPAEKLTIGLLSNLQDVNPDLVTRLVSQTFLRDHTAGDREALVALWKMSLVDPEYTRLIASLGKFGDADGITNADAHILAVMALPYANDDYWTLVRLAFYGTVQQGTYTGDTGNSVAISVVRDYQPSTAASTTTMTQIKAAVDYNEDLMGAALPTDFVGLLLAEYPGAAGANDSWVMQVDAAAEWLWTSQSLLSVLTHEVAHYWWYGNSDWLDEGAANYAAAYALWRLYDASDVYTSSYPCPFYRTIEHLVADAPTYGDSEGSLCNYSLGERLFIHLDRATTTADFERRFRNLYSWRQNTKFAHLTDEQLLMAAYCPKCAGRETVRGLSEMGRSVARWFGEKALSDQSVINGTISGLGAPGSAVRLENQSGTNRQYGFATLPSTSQDQRRWLVIPFPNATGADRREYAPVYVSHYHEEVEPWLSTKQSAFVSVKDGYGRMQVHLGAQEHRATGHHWVYVYDSQGRKLAEVEYQVVP